MGTSSSVSLQTAADAMLSVTKINIGSTVVIPVTHVPQTMYALTILVETVSCMDGWI